MGNIYGIKGNLADCTGEAKLRIRENSLIIVKDGKIAGIYRNEELPEEFRDIRIEDYSGRLIIPGLTDLHLHAPQFTFRGIGTDMELLDWLNTYTFPEESRYADMEYAEKAYKRFVKSLRKSFTARACIFATLHTEATLLLMNLLEESGIISMVGKVNMDRNSPAELIEGSAEASLEATREWLNKASGYERTKPVITPRFIPSCSDELMRGLGNLAKESGVPLQSHLSENPSEMKWVSELCPDSCGYLDAYDKRGVLENPKGVIMAHCVYSGEEEQKLIKDREIYIAHCPQSNTSLSSGIAPVRKFMEKGINVGLGSDVAAGYSMSMLRIASEAVGVSKLYWRMADDSAKPLATEEAFFLASRGGGSFFGNAGAFEEGYAADVLVIDDSELSPKDMYSTEERLERLVYMSEEVRLEAKYVEGNRLWRD